MQIIQKTIASLKPYAKNPRKNDHAVKYVEASIKEFGFRVPIIIDANNVVVAGHTRLKAAEKLGMTEVPCIVADDLTPEQIKAFRLADNKTGEFAHWDFSLLDEELLEIPNIDMGQFEFRNTEIDWSKVEEISDENYEKPESDKLRCPICGGVDEKIRFVKVE